MKVTNTLKTPAGCLDPRSKVYYEDHEEVTITQGDKDIPLGYCARCGNLIDQERYDKVGRLYDPRL